jgi:hypothetical protein
MITERDKTTKQQLQQRRIKMETMTKAQKIITAIAHLDTAHTYAKCFKDYKRSMNEHGKLGYASNTFYQYTADFRGLNHSDMKKVIGWLNRGTIGITEARKWAIDQKKHY